MKKSISAGRARDVAYPARAKFIYGLFGMPNIVVLSEFWSGPDPGLWAGPEFRALGKINRRRKGSRLGGFRPGEIYLGVIKHAKHRGIIRILVRGAPGAAEGAGVPGPWKNQPAPEGVETWRFQAGRNLFRRYKACQTPWYYQNSGPGPARGRRGGRSSGPFEKSIGAGRARDLAVAGRAKFIYIL